MSDIAINLNGIPAMDHKIKDSRITIKSHLYASNALQSLKQACSGAMCSNVEVIFF